MLWKRTQFGSWQGYLGAIHLFTVSQSMTRETDGRSSVLSTTLPGYSKLVAKSRWATVDEAKSEAERIWVLFKKYTATHEEDGG